MLVFASTESYVCEDFRYIYSFYFTVQKPLKTEYLLLFIIIIY